MVHLARLAVGVGLDGLLVLHAVGAHLQGDIAELPQPHRRGGEVNDRRVGVDHVVQFLHHGVVAREVLPHRQQVVVGVLAHREDPCPERVDRLFRLVRVIAEAEEEQMAAQLGDAVHGQRRLKGCTGRDMQVAALDPFKVHVLDGAVVQRLLGYPCVHVGEELARPQVLGEIDEGVEVVAHREVHAAKDHPTVLAVEVVNLHGHLQAAYHLRLDPLLLVRHAVGVEQFGLELLDCHLVLPYVGEGVVIELVLAGDTEHRVDLAAQFFGLQIVVDVLFLPVVGFEQQAEGAVSREGRFVFARLVLDFAQQFGMQFVEHVDERPCGDGAGGGGAEGQTLAARTHRRPHDIHQTHHVALAVHVRAGTELVPVHQLRKRSVFGLAPSRERHDGSVADIAVLRFPVRHFGGHTEAVLGVHVAEHELNAAIKYLRLKFSICAAINL